MLLTLIAAHEYLPAVKKKFKKLRINMAPINVLGNLSSYVFLSVFS
jgi:hypothetical protein